MRARARTNTFPTSWSGGGGADAAKAAAAVQPTHWRIAGAPWDTLLILRVPLPPMTTGLRLGGSSPGSQHSQKRGSGPVSGRVALRASLSVSKGYSVTAAYENTVMGRRPRRSVSG